MNDNVKPTDARQGRITGRMRYVLMISIGLAIVALAIAFGFVG